MKLIVIGCSHQKYCSFKVSTATAQRIVRFGRPGKMALIIREILNYYHYANSEISDPRAASNPFLSTPFPMMVIIGFYYYVVKHLGPAYMKDRPAYNLHRVMQIYNVIQIALSLFAFKKALDAGWFTTYSWTCEPVDFSDDPVAVDLAGWVFLYFVLKVTELLDTVFFVLRKKTKSVSFLHVYHHGVMIFAVWVGAKYFAGGHVTFVGLINSLVHAVMYSYYLLTSIYPEQKKNIWWKKHITQMQMVQFLILAVHSGQLFFQPNCDIPIILPMLLFPQSLFMFVMFNDFYMKAYSKQKIVQLKKHE